MMPKLSAILAPAATFLLLLGLWQTVAALQLYPEYLFPSPAAVARGAGELFASGELWPYVYTSLLRFVAGYGAASIR